MWHCRDLKTVYIIYIINLRGIGFSWRVTSNPRDFLVNSISGRKEPHALFLLTNVPETFFPQTLVIENNKERVSCLHPRGGLDSVFGRKESRCLLVCVTVLVFNMAPGEQVQMWTTPPREEQPSSLKLTFCEESAWRKSLGWSTNLGV